MALGQSYDIGDVKHERYAEYRRLPNHQQTQQSLDRVYYLGYNLRHEHIETNK